MKVASWCRSSAGSAPATEGMRSATSNYQGPRACSRRPLPAARHAIDRDNALALFAE